MPSPDQMGSPFPAARAMPLSDGYGGKITAMDELPIHALGDDYAVEGNGTVTRLPALPAGMRVDLRMVGAPTFKNSTRLICPNGVDYVASVGDLAIVRADGDGVWRLFVLPASGESIADRSLSFSATQQNQIQKNAGLPAVMRSYIAGLTLSTAGSSASFSTAIGVAADSTNASLMSLGSSYTKTNGAWAVGSSAGSLDTGSIAASTGYTVYLIQRVDTGVTDVLISLSSSAPAMPTNYTLFRRIGWMWSNGSSQWDLFSQNGDEFLWSAAVNDINTATLGTTATLFSLRLPTGVKVNALWRAGISASATNQVLINAVDEAGIAGGSLSAGGNGNVNGIILNTSLVNPMGSGNTRTNTSAQIRAVASGASTSLILSTYGWIDSRGRNL